MSNVLLGWRSLTSVINEAKAPANFVMNLLFGASEPKPTKNIELSYVRRGRLMAPFVKRNGAAVMTEGDEETFRIVSPPHIRTKRPMTASELLDKRRPGYALHVEADDVQRAMREYIAKELKYQMDDILNREEWMACQMLRGSLAYEAADQVSFEIDLGRDADHTIDVGAGSALYWDEAGSDPSETFQAVQELMDTAVSLQATHVILGSEAATAFIKNAQVRTDLDPRRLITGSLDLNTKVQQNGAQYLGAPYNGIQVWAYRRQVTDETGTAVDLIRPKYAEFVSATPEAENVVYYGAIEDMKAIGAGRLLQSKRFAKQWEEEDPSARMLLVESNPLPFPRRPESMVSAKVVSG